MGKRGRATKTAVDIGRVPVVDNGGLAVFVTRKDILKVVGLKEI